MKAIRPCYPEGKTKAFTLSYDDGTVEDRRLVPIFNKNKLKATFHINSGPILEGNGGRISKEEVKDLYAGHEISVHSVTHPFLDRCSRDVIAAEVLEDRRNLERLCGYPVRGMSYPMGTWNNDVLKALDALGIVYSRTTQATGNFSLPQNWLLWHPTAHHSHNILELADTFFARNYVLDLLYVWGHSFEFERPNCKVTWAMIEEFCEKMSGHSEIWYATNIEIHDYITAQRRLIYSADLNLVTNPSALSVWILVDGQPMEIPGGAVRSI